MTDLETAIIALATATITGGVALASVYLTNKSNNEQLRYQLDHDTTKKHQELNRERAEELYERVEQWMNGMFFNYLNLTYVMQKESYYNQYLDQIIEHGNKSETNYVRLEMIVNIYLTELQPSYKTVIENRENVNDIASNFKRDYERGKINGEKYLSSFLLAQEKLEASVATLKNDMLIMHAMYNKLFKRDLRFAATN